MLRHAWISAVFVATAPASAETLVVRPDACPVSADVAVYRGPEGAPDLHAPEAPPVVVYVDLNRPGWASRLLLARFEVNTARPVRDCAAAR